MSVHTSVHFASRSEISGAVQHSASIGGFFQKVSVFDENDFLLAEFVVHFKPGAEPMPATEKQQ